jgi:tRNA pseudouridine38-40 synthase
MARYKVILAYDGTDFHGFQRQVNHAKIRTVQETVETALCRIGWQGHSILAAGRTDAGVHAAGQVIAFDFNWRHSPHDLLAALNANLPADVAVRNINVIRSDFHPRYDACARSYHYSVYCEAMRDPLLERFAWRVSHPVDFQLMEVLAEEFLGEHDFAAFGKPPKIGGSTIRRVFSAGWLEEASGWVFRITANAFLYHMVRRLVSFQIAIGQGKIEPEIIRNCFESGNQELIKGLAPPQGLTLIEVKY